ncbi:bap31 domain-containing protein [Colletotrichum asianum]|uniref:Endoplasmic reticulum transmembrane protein n=1 Tax=Colletotrichum asianum TaxID=702518 RepID=A0A8H3ZU89_9PEZI|nr:bap31 domain-containing protein [Colletotrichum asianum]
MTLYYTLVFMLLMAEMGLFMLLIVPLPFAIKRRLFTFISESPIVAKVQYWMKITFVFILILFIDSVNRVYRVQVELALATEKQNSGCDNRLTHNLSNRAAVMGHERLEVQARKFYSQRNMYLCGFTLFLSLILNRTYVMILEVMRLEDKVRSYEGTQGNTKQSEKLAVAGDAGEIAKLKKELERKDRDIETLKKQSAGLHKSYDELSEQYGQTQPKGDKKAQ